MTSIDSKAGETRELSEIDLAVTEMTNIVSKELSADELEAVSGGDYSFMPSAPSKQTVQTIGAVVGAVTGVVTGSSLVVGTNLLYGAGHIAGDADAHNSK
jgi:hypothetical protein